MEQTSTTAPISSPSSPLPPSDRLIRIDEVRQLLGNPSIPSIYRWMQRGLFPRPQRIGLRGVGWKLSDVMRFVDEGFKSAGGNHE